MAPAGPKEGRLSLVHRLAGWQRFDDVPVPYSIYWAFDADTRDMWLVVLPRTNVDKKGTHWCAIPMPEPPEA